MKKIYKTYHTIEDIFFTEKKVILKCKTSIKKFKQVEYFESSIFGILKSIEIYRDKDLVYYQVELDKNKVSSQKEEFHAILKNGKKERVWKPDSILKKESLPKGYAFTNRYLNLSYQKEPLKRITSFVPILKSIEYTKENLYIKGYLFLPILKEYDITKFKMKFIKFREEDISFEFPFKLTLMGNNNVFGIFSTYDFYKFNDAQVFLFDIEIPLSIVSQYSGLFKIVIDNENQAKSIRNYHSSLTKDEKTSTYPITDRDLAFLNFYYDDIVSVWKLEIYHMKQSEYKMLSSLESAESRDNNIWLIGEYTISARDNGMHFYNYMLKRNPNIEFYYVIEKKSEDLENLNSQLRVIEYGSYKHFEIASKAGVLVFSHMPNYLIPKIDSITEYKNRYNAYLKVFLQHGVIATTTSMNMVKREIREYNLFNVSSDFEKNIIVKYLNYKDDEVVINGLPRWDRLYNEKRTSATILIIPTYRNDLEQVKKETFIKSEYFKFWNRLLNSDRFIKYIEDNNIKVYFFIHIILSRFAEEFNINSKHILLKNSDNIQDLLLECGMLITDYSSVSFDSLFQNKPVVYVPFDFEHMVSLRGGGEQYIDYENDLAGKVCITVEETIDEIINRVESGWVIDKKYQERRLKFFKYIDNKNSKRVYQSIFSKIYSEYNKNEIFVSKLEKLENDNLKLQLFGWMKKIKSTTPFLIIKHRKIALSNDIVELTFSPSFVEIEENSYIFATFIIPLKKMMLDKGTLTYVWDFYLLLEDKRYRIKDYNNNLPLILKSGNYDFILYKTVYKSFSILSIRKESKFELSQYKKSISFVLFRIDYKGGVTKVIIDLANCLADYGYKVTIIAMDIKHDLSNKFYMSEKVNFEYISMNILRDKEFFPSDIYKKDKKLDALFLDTVKKYFSNLNTDIIYIPIYPSPIFLSLIDSIPPKIKKIIGDHAGRRYKIYDNILQGDNKISIDLLSNLTKDYHIFNNLSKVDAIHIVNPLVKPIYEQITDKTVIDIPNMITINDYKANEKREKVIIGIGSLKKVKNFHTLIKVFSNIKNDFPDWHLKIYGEGKEKKNLERLIEELSLTDRVSLNEFSPNVLKELRKSTIHASVSDIESFGLTIVEAMSQKSIVLSTKATIGAKYLIDDEKTGFLAESNSEKDIEEKLRYILELIENKEYIIKQVQDNAYLKSQEFTSSKLLDKWDKVLSLLS